MAFFPEQLLFCLTTDCNLDCRHCVTPKSTRSLPEKAAIKFLRECRKIGVKRVGFTGGEPFLRKELLFRLVKAAVREKMLFDRIMTNGAWFGSPGELRGTLSGLYEFGYDGSITLSIDAFHHQDIRKLALFIKTASSIWHRSDMVSAAYVCGSGEKAGEEKFRRLAKRLGGKLIGIKGGYGRIVARDHFIKIHKIGLSPIGKAAGLGSPWGGKWFRPDRCEGPGNVFYVMPNGDVKPCCGYATDLKALTIGNIKRDTASAIMRRIKGNRLVSTIFNSGLAAIRVRLEKSGVIFPGKACDSCFFCHYILKNVPRPVLSRCLDK